MKVRLLCHNQDAERLGALLAAHHEVVEVGPCDVLMASVDVLSDSRDARADAARLCVLCEGPQMQWALDLGADDVLSPSAQDEAILTRLQLLERSLRNDNAENANARADLEALIENTHGDFVLFCDTNARPVYYNSAYAKMIKELLGVDVRPGFQPHTLLDDPRDRAAWDKWHQRVLSGEHFSVEIPFEHCGRMRYFDVSFNPTRRDGEIIGFSEFTREVTERKEAILASEHNEARLNHVLEQNRIALWDADLTTGKLTLNDFWLRSLGFTPGMEQPSVRLFHERLHPDDAVRAETVWQSLTPTNPIVQDVELRVLDARGQWRWILGRAFVQSFSSDGKPTRLTGTHFDITERKQLEDELRRNQKQDAITLMAGGIAHDFNNLLAIILNSAEIMKIVGRTDDAVLQRIMSAVERGRDLVHQLLQASRQRVSAPRVAVSVLATLERIIAEHTTLIPPHVRVHFDPDALQGLQVRASALVLPRALANLITNAAQALRDRPSGAILINAERNDDRIYFTVSDDGPGIPRESLDRVFDPFFTTREDGTGLGLAVVHGLITSSGGHIAVDSRPGQGATFTFDLPAHNDDKRNQHILVATSDPLWGRALHSMLEALGYTADIVESGEAAWNTYHANPDSFALALIDDPLDDTLGPPLVERLRAHSPLPVLIAASGSNVGLLRNVESVDGIVVLQKPFKLRTLQTQLVNLIGAPPRGEGS